MPHLIPLSIERAVAMTMAAMTKAPVKFYLDYLSFLPNVL